MPITMTHFAVLLIIAFIVAIIFAVFITRPMTEEELMRIGWSTGSSGSDDPSIMMAGLSDSSDSSDSSSSDGGSDGGGGGGGD